MYSTPNPIARTIFVEDASDMAAMQAERDRLEAELEDFDVQIESEEIAHAARLLAIEEAAAATIRRHAEAQAARVAALRSLRTLGRTPGRTAVRVVEIAPRQRHQDARNRPAAYREAQCELFGAAHDAGLSMERSLRVAGAVALFGDASISSWTQLSIAEMGAMRGAINAGWFNTDWSLRRRTVPGLPPVMVAFFGGVQRAA